MINMRRVVHSEDVCCMRSAKTRVDEMVSSQCKFLVVISFTRKQCRLGFIGINNSSSSLLLIFYHIITFANVTL
jgi:hypothetical protein